jgi:PEP-CTERM motif-containing protein
MKGFIILVALLVPVTARGETALFDFNNGPIHTSFPLDLTVGEITAHFSGTGQGYSIQDPTQSIGFLPMGFSGLAISPNSVFPADLLVNFPQEIVTEFSILVAPHELNTDSTATLRVTAYMDNALVGTSTSQGTEPFLWPSSTLGFNSAAGFNRVVLHYDSPPPTGGDYGVIFVADNMRVTATVIPEPATLALFALGAIGFSLRRFANAKRVAN